MAAVAMAAGGDGGCVKGDVGDGGVGGGGGCNGGCSDGGGGEGGGDGGGGGGDGGDRIYIRFKSCNCNI